MAAVHVQLDRQPGPRAKIVHVRAQCGSQSQAAQGGRAQISTQIAQRTNHPVNFGLERRRRIRHLLGQVEFEAHSL